MKKFKEKSREENQNFTTENNINDEIGAQSVVQTSQINAKDKKSDLQQLCEAAEEGKLELVKELLEQGVNADEPDEYGNTALHYAISEGHFAVINLLLKHVAKLDLKDNDGFTPLHRAAARNYQLIVGKLLEKGAEIIGDEDGNTPLHCAASENNLELVQTILENYQGTKDIVNEVNNFGWSIMHSAAYGITHKRVD
jgi:ankyrin repeat protein